MSSFKIVDETGKFRKAELILNFEFESDKYCLYAVKRDSSRYNLFVSKLVFHSNDNIVLVDLDDEKKNEIDKVIHFIIKNPDFKLLKSARINVINDIYLDNIDNLLFTTYKTYVFSIKEELFLELLDKFNNNLNDTMKLGFNSLVNSRKNNDIIFNGDSDNLSEEKDVIKKINIERLDINNEEDLEVLFVKEKIKTPNNRGFIRSNITVLILGILSFILVTMLLMINFG